MLRRKAWTSRNTGSSALQVGKTLLPQQELHVGSDRADVGAAVVVHRALPLQVPPRRRVHLGKVGGQGQRKRADRQIPVPQAQQHRRDLARVIGPARRIEHERRKRRPLAVGDVQLEEHRLQVELRVAQPDVALAADRAAMTEHAVDLEADLHPVGPKPPAQAHRQPVIGIRGRVQTIMVPKCGRIAVRVLFRIGNRPFPVPTGIADTPRLTTPASKTPRAEAPLRPRSATARSSGVRQPVGSPPRACPSPGPAVATAKIPTATPSHLPADRPVMNSPQSASANWECPSPCDRSAPSSCGPRLQKARANGLSSTS